MTENPEKTRPLERSSQPPVHLSGQTVGRYEVGERLGAGGMGEVYRAWDPLLKRTVALKRVALERANEPQRREELLHEARTLSSLSHRAIASVFDVVEAHDQLFIVEEFVPGTSLRERLSEPMELDAFFPIAKACLSALEEAEQRGIVHCDIKPENIVLTEDDRPKILDFGLAQHAKPAGDGKTASTWWTPSERRGGTTSYLSPEAIVEARADARSDLWALGVVFYEMLTGRHPFRRETPTETATSILTEEPPRPRQLRTEVSKDLDSVVMSMLVKDPEERSASATDVLSALRGDDPAPVLPPPVPRRRFVGPAITAVVGVALVAWTASKWWPGPVGAAPPVYLAVDAFESPGVDPHAEAFARGFVEAAGERLATVEGLSVVPPDTWFRLDARLGGSVHVAVDRLRVNYEVTGPDGETTGGVLNGGMEDIFELRDQLARNVSRILADRLGVEALAADAAEAPVSSPDAYAAFLRGAGYLAQGETGSAVAQLEESVATEAGFLGARIRLAEALGASADGDEAVAARAREIARDAVAAAPDRVDARRELGRLLLQAGEFEAAEAELARACEIDLADGPAARLLAEAQRRLGRPDAATATLVRAVEADPDEWLAHRALGMHLHALGRLEEALEACEGMVALTPGNARGNSTLGAMYFFLGRNAEAIDSYLESIAIEPNYRAYSNIGTVYMAEGRLEEAATNLEAALVIDDTDYRVWLNLAVTCEELPGRQADATAALERGMELAEALLAERPDDAVVLATLASAYARAGRTEEARRTVDKALVVAPDDMDVLFHAAGTFERLGERDRAVELARRALEAGFPLRMMENETGWQDLATSPEFREMVRDLAPVPDET